MRPDTPADHVDHIAEAERLERTAGLYPEDAEHLLLQAAAHLELAEDLLRATGRVLEVPERQQDAVTAISGSGPAYLFFVVEAMIDGSRNALAVALSCKIEEVFDDVLNAVDAALHHFGVLRRGAVDVGGSLPAFHQLRDGTNHEEKDGCGYQNEGDQRIQEEAGSHDSIAHFDVPLFEVRNPEEAQQRRQDVLNEREDDRAERGADDNGNGKVDNVPSQQEVAEIFEHPVLRSFLSRP